MPDVTLRPMTASEFDSLRSSLIAEYGAAQVRAGGWDEATADERASAQLDALVPQGIDTDGMLLRIAEDPGGRRVGHLWLSLAHEGSPDTAWIYDIEIAAGRRGQGFGEPCWPRPRTKSAGTALATWASTCSVTTRPRSACTSRRATRSRPSR